MSLMPMHWPCYVLTAQGHLKDTETGNLCFTHMTFSNEQAAEDWLIEMDYRGSVKMS